MTNQILSSLSRRDLNLIGPALEPAPFSSNEVIDHPKRQIKYVYFPDHGMLGATSVARRGDAAVEVALIGREGVSGISLVLGDGVSPFRVEARTDGEARRIQARQLQIAMKDSKTLATPLLRYLHSFLIQISQTAAMTALTTVEQRTARWLLMAHDRSDTNAMPFTHLAVAQALSVRRAGVTTALVHMDRCGVIKGQRGLITIIDRKRLEEFAGAAYGPADRP